MHADHLADTVGDRRLHRRPRDPRTRSSSGTVIRGEGRRDGAGTHRPVEPRQSSRGGDADDPQRADAVHPRHPARDLGRTAEQIVVQGVVHVRRRNGMPAQHRRPHRADGRGCGTPSARADHQEADLPTSSAAPVGLAVIGMLKAAGVRTIIAWIFPRPAGSRWPAGCRRRRRPPHRGPFESSPHSAEAQHDPRVPR
ncbi:hypothetical protein HBB16_11870 [Pseudonocardia sp. MCCB 268]|nr:hypothetical protein [Pseudonocardia cytotoxica]